MSKAGLVPFDQLDPTAEWAPWRSAAAEPWSPKGAAHLYRRAAFGPTRDELCEAVAAGLDATLDTLFAAPKQPAARPPSCSARRPCTR